MGSKDPRIDAYIAKSAPFARPILARLRKAVHDGCPEVDETLKWGAPAFDYKGMLGGMAAFKAHCIFGFWKSALLEGSGAKPRETIGRLGRLTAVADLPPARDVVALVREAAGLNEQGVKVPRRRTAPKPPPVVPADFAKMLRANKKARAAFDAFSPSHQREYIEWIIEAKTDGTRERRMATAIEWLSEGRSRNWKYERKG